MRLIDDPRWLPFVARYANDCERFAIEVCGEIPTWQQSDLYRSVTPHGSKTSVSSGRGTGKSRASGVISTWHMLCHFSWSNLGSITILTATKVEQVRKVTWKEIVAVQARIRQGPCAWIADYYTIESERVYVKEFKDTWWIIAKTAPKGSPENLSGFHGEWMFILADEASGIPEDNLATLVGTMTDDRNRMLMTSQPTRSVGYFYESQNKLSIAQGGQWNALIFDSELSPLVSRSWLEARALEYGGVDSEQYLIMVRGQFSLSSSKFLIARPWLDRAFTNPNVIPAGMPFGWMVLVDVAAGELRDKSVITVAKVAGFSDFGADARRMEIVDIPVHSNSIQPHDLASRTHQIVLDHKDASCLVDAGGMGAIFCKELEALDTPNLIKVKWGNPCFSTRHKERFVNQRAQCSVFAMEALKDSRLGIHVSALRSEIISQGSRLPYGYDERARYQIAKKGSKEWEGMPSPDIFDTICFGFLADAHFTITDEPEASEQAPDDGSTPGKSALEKAREAFADA